MLPIADTYPALTKKVLSTMVAVNRNVDFKYFVKCDDDTYVR
jgi:hypothetical protein